MVNNTYIIEFNLEIFSSKSDYTTLTTSVFFPLYISGMLINSIIITLIYIDAQLHTPMYLFLCNLALVDICYTTTIVPNLLYMLLSGDNTVSFIQCFTQMFFYLVAATTEDILVFIMAYDRYVAICHPLHYHYILNKKNCVLITAGTWITGSLNSIVFTITVSHMSFCHSNIIHQLFCDAKALLNISSSVVQQFNNVIYAEVLVFAVFPFLFCLTSYIKIIRVILHIKSKDGRKKAFSTCSSHLTVVIFYYVTGVSVYMVPPSESTSVLELVFTAVYAVVTPVINLLIYSLRNREVKKSLLRIMQIKQSIKS